MKPDISLSPRIPKLRDYYLHNSAMVLNRDLVPWHCGRSLLLYTEGWLKGSGEPTVKLRRSAAEAYLLINSQPVIRSGELIAGQPDFCPFSPEEQTRYDEYRKLYYSVMPPKRGRADHMALDYPKLLSLGVEGMIAEAKKFRDALNPYDGHNAEKYELFQGCITELKGVLVLEKNYADHARSMAESTNGSERAELLELAAVLDRVPAKPAVTFREALQSIHLFMYSLYGIYSVGRPDQYLLPYYRRDIENGILTEAGAQELIDCFCLQYMNNMSAWAAAGFMLGGRDGDGHTVENELTWHFLAAIAHTHTPDPNVGFCVTSETSPEMLSFAVQIIKDGHGNPQIWNNDAVTKSMLNCGYDSRAANLFTHSTCVEITPIGCSGVSITSPYINMLQIFLDVFNSCDDAISFDGLFEYFSKYFDAYCIKALRQENLWQLERSRNGTDPIRISALIDNCMERGLPSDSGGARYNLIEPNILGMTNVIESFNIVRELVYRQKKLTLSEFRKVLADNYVGHDELRATIIHSTEHFGMCTPSTNEIAKRISDMVLETFSHHTTFRGARVIPGAFSYRDHEINGHRTGASPDGRLNGMPLADGSSPVQGYDRLGPTLSICSIAVWEPARFLGGTTINVKLNGDTGVETITDLIRGFLKTNSAQMQFNIVDTEQLLDAQRNPDRYNDLLVRIGGYSDYFTRIPKGLQDDVISRSRS